MEVYPKDGKINFGNDIDVVTKLIDSNRIIKINWLMIKIYIILTLLITPIVSKDLSYLFFRLNMPESEIDNILKRKDIEIATKDSESTMVFYGKKGEPGRPAIAYILEDGKLSEFLYVQTQTGDYSSTFDNTVKKFNQMYKSKPYRYAEGKGVLFWKVNNQFVKLTMVEMAGKQMFVGIGFSTMEDSKYVKYSEFEMCLNPSENKYYYCID